jgi:mono/diheme cytochrome c family protein
MKQAMGRRMETNVNRTVALRHLSRAWGAWPAPWRRAGGGGRRGAAALLLATALAACEGGPPVDAGALAALPVPREHRQGEELYRVWCAACHGPQATGTEEGPPLVHPVYRTRHHGDEAFQLAVSQGVRAHHFRFGDMPRVEGLSREEVAAITGYVRWLQREAGIEE